MTQFVSQQSRQFSFIFQGQQDAPGTGNGSAGKGVGVDIGRVDHMKIVGHVGAVGLPGHVFARAVNVAV